MLIRIRRPDNKYQATQVVEHTGIIMAAFRTYRKVGHDWRSIKAILDGFLNADGSLTDEKRQEILTMAKEFQDSNARLGVLSLSEDPFSILMWHTTHSNIKAQEIFIDKM